MAEELIYKGAEAELYKSKYMDMPAVLKKRIAKEYRIKEIDDKIRSERIKTEAGMIKEARRAVATPYIFDIDMPQKILTMAHINGTKLRDLFYEGKDIAELSRQAGEDVLRLHDKHIIHGDLTTSNMIEKNGKIYFIDFGLALKSKKDEDKAMDIKVFRDMLKSTHYKHFDEIWKAFQEGYGNKKILRKVLEIEKRARYVER